uniref:sn-1-specific diacylglycerol lipase ABHD11 n=1 Tax=Graphocephala atropunctata TaxID=36148 RepID=A0A1B6KFR9_9HEMI
MFVLTKFIPLRLAKPNMEKAHPLISCFLSPNIDISTRSYHNDEAPPLNLKLSIQKFAEPVISINTIPIIVLHGLLGSKNNWNAVCKALAKQNFRTIVSVDARNHGDSPHHKDFDYESMATDVATLLRSEGYEKASFIGHSMGGRTVMLLAQMFPEVVHSMVIVDISPVRHSPSMVELPKLLKIIKELDMKPTLTLSDARKQATTQLLAHKVDQKVVSFLLTNLVENERRTHWRWKFNLHAIADQFHKICNYPILETDVPTRTLFIGGMDSDYLRPEDESSVKKIFPKSTFEYIKGAGHWVHADKPHEFIELTSAFFKKERSYFETVN